VEYQEKWRHGLLPGTHYQPHLEEGHGEEAGHDVAATYTEEAGDAEEAGQEEAPAAGTPEAVPPAAGRAPAPEAEGALEPAEERSQIQRAPPGPAGLAPEPAEAAGPEEEEGEEGPSNVHIFFGVYFIMTGLHGVHVIAGMVVIGWLIRRARRGDFGPRYFTPVDLGGLYWHLVDLIWIFLFPLLYLIE
jgi:cytochrome c oxidase subunit 3